MNKNTKHVIQLFSDTYGFVCELCEEKVRDLNDGGNLSNAINHYLQEHGCELLHVGTYSFDGRDGLTHGTTAVLGSETVPQERELPDIESKE